MGGGGGGGGGSLVVVVVVVVVFWGDFFSFFASSESILFTAYIINPLNSTATPLHCQTGNQKFVHCIKST